jgi:hypothetical protein
MINGDPWIAVVVYRTIRAYSCTFAALAAGNLRIIAVLPAGFKP